MNQELKYTVTSDDILGKDVLASDGGVIGIVQKLHIDKRTKEISGITVDEGFMKPDVFVGINNIKLFGVDSVFLKIVPDILYKGLKVFDKNGKNVGSVISIKKSHGGITDLRIKNGKWEEIIPKKKIKSIGINVILR